MKIGFRNNYWDRFLLSRLWLELNVRITPVLILEIKLRRHYLKDEGCGSSENKHRRCECMLKTMYVLLPLVPLAYVYNMSPCVFRYLVAIVKIP
jgi:hypothetical protein